MAGSFAETGYFKPHVESQNASYADLPAVEQHRAEQHIGRVVGEGTSLIRVLAV
jgi:hypothetical protein